METQKLIYDTEIRRRCMDAPENYVRDNDRVHTNTKEETSSNRDALRVVQMRYSFFALLIARFMRTVFIR